MLNKYFSITILIFLLFNLNLLAQSNYEKLLREIQKNDRNVSYSYEQNELVISYSLGKQSVRMIAKDVEIDSKTKSKIGVIVAPVALLPENYSPSKNLLYKLSQLNNECSPGVILMNEEFKMIIYITYFWPDELTKNTFANEVRLAAENSLYSQEQIQKVLNIYER